jgi:release factor H-coupled RctB family protein
VFRTAEVLASPKSWIETDAVQRLEATAALPGMVRAVAMPNLHPGKGAPIGAVVPAPAGSTRS